MGQSHPGQHESILERGIWQQVQQRLSNAARRGSEPSTEAPASPLTGKVFDENDPKRFKSYDQPEARWIVNIPVGVA